jgi:Uma2 family endonuclease
MSAILAPTRHKLSVEDYHKLGDAGVLSEDSRVELIEGELIDMAPIGGSHMRVVNRLTKLLVSAVGDLGVVSVQNPVTLPPHSEPQPDLAILGPGADSTGAGVPHADDVVLLIEVADSTLAYDRSTKLQLYARHGIREVWIVNLPDQVLEMYREPKDGAYRVKLERLKTESASPGALPTVRVDLSEILGA